MKAKLFILFIIILNSAILMVPDGLLAKCVITKTVDTTVSTAKNLYDSTTCGPAAAYVLLKLYGKNVSIKDIKEEVLIDTDGHSSVNSVSQALAKRGIYARGDKLTLKQLETQYFPAIVLSRNPKKNNENHFLVYLGSDKKNVTTRDSHL